MTDFKEFEFPDREIMIKFINNVNKELFNGKIYSNACVFSDTMIKCIYFMYHMDDVSFDESGLKKFTTSEYPIELNGLVSFELSLFSKNYFEQSVKCKNPLAIYNCAVKLYNERKYTESLSVFQEAIQLGWYSAFADLGDMYKGGYLIKRDEKLAIKYFSNLLICIYEKLIFNIEIEPLDQLKSILNNEGIFHWVRHIPNDIAPLIIDNVEQHYSKLNLVRDVLKNLNITLGLINIVRQYDLLIE
jgi:hypothetical protein